MEEKRIIVDRHVEKFRRKIDLWLQKKLEEYDDDDGDNDVRAKNPSREEYKLRLKKISEKKFADGREKILKAAATASSMRRKYSEKEPSRVDRTVDSARCRSETNIVPPDLCWPFKCLGLSRESTRTAIVRICNKNGGSVEKSDVSSKTSGVWSKRYKDAERDLVVDIGSGQGRFLLRYALEIRNIEDGTTLAPHFFSKDDEACHRNFLGLEIRRGLVESSTNFSEVLGLTDTCAFVHTNVNAEFVRTSLKSYPGNVKLICFQLPDPRLQKNMNRGGAKLLTSRRILDSEMCDAVVDVLTPGGAIYLSSDYEEVFKEMCGLFEHVKELRPAKSDDFARLRILDAPADGKLGSDCGNPIGIPTEREIFLQQKDDGREIFRAAYVKKGTCDEFREVD
eukprot:g601.t1